jgi:zinc transporter
MGTDNDFETGIEPGLRFAMVLDGLGGCREIHWDGVEHWRPEDGFLWIHLERDTAEAAEWLTRRSTLDPMIVEALIAEDTRPRVEAGDDGLLLILRGVNIAETECVELVPMHAWIDRHRAVTLRDTAHHLTALRGIRSALKRGRGPRTGGALLVQIAEKIVSDLEPLIDDLESQMDRLEDAINATPSQELRRELSGLRRQAVHLRRYLSPQREALDALRLEPTPLLDGHDRKRLRWVIDWISRHVEDLEAVHDRAAILQEDLAAVISEGIAKSTHRFTAIASLLLPPSLIAAILGANIGGIPGSGHPLAFLWLILIIAGVLGIQYLILRRLHWL